MNILNQLIEIIFWKRHPKDIDYNVKAASIAYFMTTILMYSLFDIIPEYTRPIAYSLSFTSTALIPLYLLLKLKKKESRFIQTVTALCGTSLILIYISVALSLVPLISILSLIPILYLPFIMATVIKSSLDCSFIASIAALFAFYFIANTSLQLFFPQFTSETLALLEATQQHLESTNVK